MKTFAPRRSPNSRPLRRLIVARAVVAGIFVSGHSNRVSATALYTINSVLGTWSEEAAGNIPVVKDGKMQVHTAPGLGIMPNDDYLKANRAEGEPWWG